MEPVIRRYCLDSLENTPILGKNTANSSYLVVISSLMILLMSSISVNSETTPGLERTSSLSTPPRTSSRWVPEAVITVSTSTPTSSTAVPSVVRPSTTSLSPEVSKKTSRCSSSKSLASVWTVNIYCTAVIPSFVACKLPDRMFWMLSSI